MKDLLTEIVLSKAKANLVTAEENFLADARLRQLLKSYGLTKNQTRILAILTQNKTYLSVKQISQLSNIARKSIYQILFNLKEKGLIEKAITTPKKYRVIPLKTILQILHHQKTSQIHDLEKLLCSCCWCIHMKAYKMVSGIIL